MANLLPLPPTGTPYIDPRTGTVALVWQNYLLALERVLIVNVAPKDGTYWVSQANSDLTNETNLGLLSTGYLKITTALGVATPSSVATIPTTGLSGTLQAAQFPALTGDVTTTAGSLTTTIGPNRVTLAMLAQIATARVLGRTTAGTGNVEVLSALPNAIQDAITRLGTITVGVWNGTIVGLAFGGTNADLSATGGASQVLKQASAGAVITVGQLASTDITGLASGTYTPTLTNVANLSASTAFLCQYLRVGNTVTVSGKVDVDPTLTVTSTQLGLSLPIASNFGNAEDCGGVAFAPAIAGQGAAILGDAANNRAQMEWIASDVTNQPMYFTFSYRVI